MADSMNSGSPDRDITSQAPRRCWHSGTATPEPTVLDELEAADPNPRCAYDQEAGRQIGPWVNMMTQLRGRLRGLQPQATMRLAPNLEKRLHQLLLAVARSCETSMDRLAVLKSTGTFHFRRGESAEIRKSKLQSIVADPADEAEEATRQVRLLMEIWSPRNDSLLDSIINRPVEAGRTLSKRLDSEHEARLSIFTRSANKMDHGVQHPLIESRSVAYERGGAIHLLDGLQEYLNDWQAGEEEKAKKGFTLFETLILHELVELILEDTSPELDHLSSHVIASTLEHCIHGDAVARAVADYCDRWAEDLRPAAVSDEVEMDETQLQERLDAEIQVRELDDDAEDGAEDIPSWTDYLITHEELRPEAYEMRTYAEQREILREMFGEDVSIE